MVPDTISADTISVKKKWCLTPFRYSFSEALFEEENLLDYLLDVCFKFASLKEWEKVKYIPANALTDNEYWSRWAMGKKMVPDTISVNTI